VSVRVGEGWAMRLGESGLNGFLEPMRVGKCELTTKFTQLRQLQNVVTLKGISGDPHYSSMSEVG